jgi:predicted negative regulator of RcsB-dependent stress response
MTKQGLMRSITTRYRMDINRGSGLGLQQGWQRYKSRPILKRLVLLFLIVLASVAFLQYKHLHTCRQARTASFIYDKLLIAIQTNQETEAVTQIDSLMHGYKATVYAPMAALMAAKLAVTHEQWDKALEHLHFVLSHSPKGSFAEIARLRMVDVLNEQKKYKEALALLEQVKPVAYLPLVEELKGDIYVLMQERHKAREAYAKAMQALPMDMPLAGRLQLKQIEIGGLDENKKESS